MEPQTIYIVRGRSGEWADHTTWNVCWRATIEDAEAIRRLCQDEAEAYCHWYNSRTDDNYEVDADIKYREGMFDKWICGDRNGVDYSVETLSEDVESDIRWIERKKWNDEFRAKKAAERAEVFTLDDPTPLGTNLGEVMRKAFG